MSLPDEFVTVTVAHSAELKERSSRFIAYVFPLETEEQAKAALNQLKKEHYSAAHHCWAFVLNPDASFQKSSDDREPSGTAGKPILRAILSAGLTNVMVVVVRYFGGKLLGVPGLIAAYGQSAELVLQEANKKQKKLRHIYQVLLGYEHQHQLIRVLKQAELKFYPCAEAESEGIIFEVSPSKNAQVLQKIKEELLLEPKYIRDEK